MGAGNVQAVFDRYANRLPWRTFAALVWMAKTSIDAHAWPYYSGGLDALAAALFQVPEPSTTQQRDVRRMVRDMVNDRVLTKDRAASSLRRREKDRPARYRLNIHESADLARKQWEADSTGVKDPSTANASTGVIHPSTDASSTGVSDPSSTGVIHPPQGPKHRGESPLEGALEPEEQVEEHAHAGSGVRGVPRPDFATSFPRLPGEPLIDPKPVEPSPFCAEHPEGTDRPCRACGIARRKADDQGPSWATAISRWNRQMAAWHRWNRDQPRCEHQYPGGANRVPGTGLLACGECCRAERSKA